MNNTALFRITYVCLFLASLEILKWFLPIFITDLYSQTARILLNLILTYNLYFLVKRWYFDALVSAYDKAVLITGCDTGFGHETAKRLDSRGFVVFAGCLFPEGDGAQRLKQSCSNRLHILHIDVTKDDSVQSAFNYVKNNLGNAEFWAVVNNAGIVQGIDVQLTPLNAYVNCIEVNALGVVRVTKTFLPLLRSSKGRVVNVTSIAARLAIMQMSPYAMSKFAAVAFTECLRLEMAPWGIKAISIEPEFFRTGMTDPDAIRKIFLDVKKELDAETLACYGDAFFEKMEKYTLFITNQSCRKTDKVVDCIDDAVSLEHPNDVYRPSKNILFSFIFNLCPYLPKSILDEILRFGYYICRFPRPENCTL